VGDQLIPVFVKSPDRKHLEDSIKKYRDDLLKREYMSRMVPFAKARELLMRVKAAGMKIVLAYDAEASGKLGIRTIGLTCGAVERTDLLRAGCAEVFRDPQHLLNGVWSISFGKDLTKCA